MAASLEISILKKKIKLKRSEGSGFIELNLRELPNQPDPNMPTRFRVNFMEDERLGIFEILTSIDGELKITRTTS